MVALTQQWGGAYNAKLVIQTCTTCFCVPFGPLFEKTFEFFNFGVILRQKRISSIGLTSSEKNPKNCSKLTENQPLSFVRTPQNHSKIKNFNCFLK